MPCINSKILRGSFRLWTVRGRREFVPPQSPMGYYFSVPTQLNGASVIATCVSIGRLVAAGQTPAPVACHNLSRIVKVLGPQYL